MERILGAVLAGGRSSRFGSDKAAALIDGRSMLDWVVAALAPQVDAIVVCGRPSSAGYDGIDDRPAADLGPLGGLNAALHHGAAHGYDAVLTVPCDTPLLPADLRDQLGPVGNGVIVAELPVIGLWPVTLAAALDAFLGNGGSRALAAWADHAGARAAALRALPLNVNRPTDLDGLKERPT
jgi:molybdopterin-guanine dinucleotide biosynthesis protein A